MLDACGRAVRRDAKHGPGCDRRLPFGGLQLVSCGDFFQLPPVGLGSYGKLFAFQSPAWQLCGMVNVVLTQVVRQQGDQRFVRMLNELRLGVASPHTLDVLASCHVSRKPPVADGILPTKLYCTNANVDEENASRLKALPGESVTFRAGDNLRGGSVDAKLMELAERKVRTFDATNFQLLPTVFLSSSLRICSELTSRICHPQSLGHELLNTPLSSPLNNDIKKNQ